VWKGLGVFVGHWRGVDPLRARDLAARDARHAVRESRRDRGGSKFRDRLVGFDLIAHNPFALIPVMVSRRDRAVLRPPAALVEPAAQPAWRDAILVTL
jgi:hypothetical protein